MAKGASPRSGAAPAGVLRTHTSGRPWVTVRPKYVGLPVRAGRGPDERGRKPAGSGRVHAPRPVPEARSQSPKSPPVERREASASSHDAHRASHARTIGAPSGAPLPLTLFSGRRKRTTAYPAPQTIRAAELCPNCHARKGGHPVNTAVADYLQIRCRAPVFTGSSDQVGRRHEATGQNNEKESP
jgi:hypothetical protein